MGGKIIKMGSEIKQKKIAVVYHAECLDGFTAVWAAWKKLGERAAYVPAFYQQAPSEELRDKEVYLVDFSYPPEVITKLKAANKKVAIIDHHQTAKKAAEAASVHLFDLKHSGAYLAWQYFHPGKQTPVLVRYVEDGDLWNFKLPEARAILACLSLEKFGLERWDKLAREMEMVERRREMVQKGKLILLYERAITDFMAKEAELVEFEGRKVLAVNFSYKPLTSELAHVLYEKRPPMSIVWREMNGERRVSLRSDGTVDVSEIAKKYGGGGHKAAASFSLPASALLPWRNAAKSL